MIEISITCVLKRIMRPHAHQTSCLAYAMVTCELKLFQNYFNLRRRPFEIILFQCVETCPKLFQNYFTGLLQLTNIFQHFHCRWNDFQIINL